MNFLKLLGSHISSSVNQISVRKTHLSPEKWSGNRPKGTDLSPKSALVPELQRMAGGRGLVSPPSSPPARVQKICPGISNSPVLNSEHARNGGKIRFHDRGEHEIEVFPLPKMCRCTWSGQGGEGPPLLGMVPDHRCMRALVGSELAPPVASGQASGLGLGGWCSERWSGAGDGSWRAGYYTESGVTLYSEHTIAQQNARAEIVQHGRSYLSRDHAEAICGPHRDRRPAELREL